jgi:ABC-2 type transport system permease protein
MKLPPIWAELPPFRNPERTKRYSSRVNDIRSAQQLGSLITLPLAGIFVLGENGALAIDPFHLLIVSGILLVADVALFLVRRATFQREEILTKWK